MTSNPKPQMDVVKREEKESKLKNFISSYLAATTNTDDCQPWQLIARSAESPVILALASLAPEIKAAGLDVKTLLTHVEPGLPDSATQISLGFACEVRISRDVRLLDAHEQLRLDATTSWVGDCMRREPAKRDGYERYAAGCAVTADWTARAFERLWSRGEPVLQVAAAPVKPVSAEPELDACLPQTSPVISTILVSTRH